MSQVKATILGAGAMGTALGIVLSSNGFKVVFWDIDEEVVFGINKNHKNPKALLGVNLPVSVKAEMSISKAVMGADLVIFAVASGAVREVALKAENSLSRNCVVIVASKGLESSSLKTMAEVLTDALPGDFKNQISVLSGPTLATQLAEKKPTAAMLASEKSNVYSKRALEALNCKWLVVYETRDVLGVELSGVAKHAVAIACGIMDGIGFGDNTKAWILTDAFREFSRLIWKLGGKEETVYGLAGFGDVIATSFSKDSRNRRFGELLGKGESVSKAKDSIGQTIEGISAIEALHKLADNEKLQLPILSAVFEVVSRKKKADKIFSGLLKKE